MQTAEPPVTSAHHPRSSVFTPVAQDGLRQEELSMTTTRRAACSCGKLEIVCEGEPIRISVCHCLECQRRTGAVFSSQAWFDRQQIAAISGNPAEFTRRSDAGRWVRFRFCSNCGSTVYWEAEAFPGRIAIAVGSFADPGFPPPTVAGWEQTRHQWVEPLQARS
jgi:hypothetical protein